MKPFDWDSIVNILEELGCEIEDKCEKPGFYHEDEFLYSIDDLFPEIFNRVDEFDVFSDDDLRGKEVLKHSYLEEYEQIVKVKSEYVLEDIRYSSVGVSNNRLKEAA